MKRQEFITITINELNTKIALARKDMKHQTAKQIFEDIDKAHLDFAKTTIRKDEVFAVVGLANYKELKKKWLK
jgi:hypothetical protein